jgi:hypothetical protein
MALEIPSGGSDLTKNINFTSLIYVAGIWDNLYFRGQTALHSHCGLEHRSLMDVVANAGQAGLS